MKAEQGGDKTDKMKNGNGRQSWSESQPVTWFRGAAHHAFALPGIAFFALLPLPFLCVVGFGCGCACAFASHALLRHAFAALALFPLPHHFHVAPRQDGWFLAGAMQRDFRMPRACFLRCIISIARAPAFCARAAVPTVARWRAQRACCAPDRRCARHRFRALALLRARGFSAFGAAQRHRCTHFARTLAMRTRWRARVGSCWLQVGAQSLLSSSFASFLPLHMASLSLPILHACMSWDLLFGRGMAAGRGREWECQYSDIPIPTKTLISYPSSTTIHGVLLHLPLHALPRACTTYPTSAFPACPCLWRGTGSRQDSSCAGQQLVTGLEGASSLLPHACLPSPLSLHSVPSKTFCSTCEKLGLTR